MSENLKWATFTTLGVLLVLALLFHSATESERIMAVDDCVREKLERYGVPYNESNWKEAAADCV